MKLSYNWKHVVCRPSSTSSTRRAIWTLVVCVSTLIIQTLIVSQLNLDYFSSTLISLITIHKVFFLFLEWLHGACCAFPLQGAEGEPKGEDRNAPRLGFFTCLSVEYYQRFFDVSTMEVREGMFLFKQRDTVFGILVYDCCCCVICLFDVLFNLLRQTENYGWIPSCSISKSYL